MRNTAITVVLLVIALSAHAQKHVNEFQLSFTPKYYFNKVNVENDDFKDAYISTESSSSSEFGLSYYHRFPSGITLMQSVTYGTQSQDIYTIYDLDNFDPEAVESFEGTELGARHRFSSSYISNKLMVGYSKPITKGMMKGWRVEGSVGFVFKGYRRVGLSIAEFTGSYFAKNNTEYRVRKTAYIDFNINSNEKLTTRFDDYSFDPLGIVYVGMRKELQHSIFKSLNIGLEISRLAWRSDYNRLEFTSYTYDASGDRSVHKDSYYDKNFNIGLRIAVGLWK